MGRMIYVPILKTRKAEFKVLQKSEKYFAEKIIPLVEIIAEEYKVTYEKDENGEFIRQRHGKVMRRVRCKPTEEDIITLDNLNQLVGGKSVFIDYFRFSLDKYGKNIDFAKAELSYNLNNDYNLYKQKLLSVTEYENMIPVISVKKDFDIPKTELCDLLHKLQRRTKRVGLRITEEWLDTYEIILQNELREEDYLLFDIEEQNPEYKFIELDYIAELDLKCSVILVNSPQKMSAKNGDYPECGVADLIDNCAKEVAAGYEFEGYGDYCGLKDKMPLKDGGNGKGAALALLYDFRDNVFYSFCNHDTGLGLRGYRTVVKDVLAAEWKLNPDGDCPGYEKVHKLPNGGGWSNWHYINAVRYIQQVFKYL